MHDSSIFLLAPAGYTLTHIPWRWKMEENGPLEDYFPCDVFRRSATSSTEDL